MFVAKLTTRYPEFKGEGYYNFVMADNEEELEDKIEDNSHDFRLDGIRKVDADSALQVVAEYPSKELLNKALFNV